MMNEQAMSRPRAEVRSSNADAPDAKRKRRFLIDTLVVATIGTAATWCSTKLALEVWVVFAGFIAWFTHPTSWREGASGVVCMWLGLGAGAIALVANDALSPIVGSLALPLVVFVANVFIMGLRTTRGAKNTLAWYIGIVTFFAAHLKPSAEGLLQLAAASLLGGIAGFLCLTLAPALSGSDPTP